MQHLPNETGRVLYGRPPQNLGYPEAPCGSPEEAKVCIIFETLITFFMGHFLGLVSSRTHLGGGSEAPLLFSTPVCTWFAGLKTGRKGGQR